MPVPADFLPDVLPFVQGCPTALAERAILHSVREFCEFSGIWWEDQLIDTVTDEVTTGVYQLAAATAGAEILSVKDPIYHQDQTALLKTPEWLQENYASDWRTKTSTRAKYYTMPTKTRLQLVPYPTVAGVADLRVTLLLRPALVSPYIGQLVLDEYSESISWGARARLKNDPSQDWFDKGSTVELIARFEQAKDRAKSLAKAMGQDRRHQDKRTTRGYHF